MPKRSRFSPSANDSFIYKIILLYSSDNMSITTPRTGDTSYTDRDVVGLVGPTQSAVGLAHARPVYADADEVLYMSMSD